MNLGQLTAFFKSFEKEIGENNLQICLRDIDLNRGCSIAMQPDLRDLTKTLKQFLKTTIFPQGIEALVFFV